MLHFYEDERFTASKQGIVYPLVILGAVFWTDFVCVVCIPATGLQDREYGPLGYRCFIGKALFQLYPYSLYNFFQSGSVWQTLRQRYTFWQAVVLSGF
jgi:hypothetical protein